MQYVSPPTSIKQLELLAWKFRLQVGLSHTPYFPVLEFLERIKQFFPNGPDWDVVEDHELPDGVHAQYDVSRNLISISNTVYIGASKGNGRDRMTIMHEIAHFLLIRHHGLTLNRSFGGKVEPYKDPEWQAKCLAGEIMMCTRMVSRMTPSQVALACGVSSDAASYKMSRTR